MVREKFQNKLGFILASAASAVGIGNLVGFPVFASKNGGALFLLLYLVCMLLICLPVLIAELALGRNTGLNPLGAYRKIGGNSNTWKFAGVLAVLTPFMIAVFYQVLATWLLGYFLLTVTGNLATIADPNFHSTFINSYSLYLYLAVLFILLAIVLIRGVQQGIEKVATMLMPILIVLLVFLIIFMLFQDNALAGVKFYLVPDFSKMQLSVFNSAVSQAFFSLSLGMGIMISYGSYTNKQYNLKESARNISLLDSGVAFLAGLLILPAIFVFNPSINTEQLSDSSVSLVFTFLPKIFLSLSGIFGYVLSSILAAIFFLMVFLAALTSQMSIMQVPICALQDESKFKRKKSIVYLIAAMAVFIIPCMLSFGNSKFFTEFVFLNGSYLSFFDLIITVFYETILPLNGLMICLLVILKWKMSGLNQEINQSPTAQTWADKYINLSLTSFIPLFLAVIFVTTVLAKFF